MKNSCLILILVLICSCKQEVKKEEAETTSTSTPITETKTPEPTSTSSVQNKETYSHKDVIAENVMVPFEPRFFKEISDYRELLGFYVGAFNTKNWSSVSENKGSYSNLINISINHIKKDSIFGHSVVAGNARPFQGIIDTKTLRAKVAEPGDDKYDGEFEFTFDKEGTELKGMWNAYKNIAVKEREYKLGKRRFKYDPSLNLTSNYRQSLSGKQEELMDAGYRLESIESGNLKLINSSTQKLSSKDIENLNKGELEVLRNLIYARHGYSFKNRRMRYFFDSEVDWYIPVSTDVRTQLTDLEKKNIDLIKRYEQHAEKYYDYFGR